MGRDRGRHGDGGRAAARGAPAPHGVRGLRSWRPGAAAARTVGRDPGGRLVTVCAAALLLLGLAALALVVTWSA
ncbi:hypothetical protein [Cellulomonas sp. S1-8]|uniref:hypothetical protein n=1 Tax=Cellulomonas sp. S1-8 TaxID=2904790 RepID=UPI002243382C|nr:hypothetical protein [Cellulomonas sp. S1-8]UZN04560.1 hypothetical protein OKX07_06495 [Cellulomonas sp. S1-8]